MNSIENKSIQQLENDYWPPISKGESSSYLIKTCHELRSKKIGTFEIEDLRIMIGQGIGMEYLVPKAVKELSQNILAEGDFYEGDLLKSLLTSDIAYWKANKGQWQEVCEIFEANKKILEEDDTTNEIRNGWFMSFEKFRQLQL